MNSICILLTDPFSISEKIIIKSFVKLKKTKLDKIFIIGDKKKFSEIYKKSININNIIFINIKLQKKKYLNYLKKISIHSIKLAKQKKIKYIINMPLNKSRFLKNKYPGFTEFFSYLLDKKKNENMLLYNCNFSVCPITTHVELKKVDKCIKKTKIINAIKNLVFFYKKIIKKKIKFVILGLNPHAGKDFPFNTKEKIILKVVNNFKKKINIEGPVSADTAFNNPKNKVFIGMYHDQVLIPFKMVNKFNGINITIGKKVIRMSPDHGTGEELINKPKLINNKSFLSCLKFCEKY